MDAAGRRASSSAQIQALTNSNAAMQANSAQLERENADLKVAKERLEHTRERLEQVKDRLEHRVKSLQVAVTILLAATAGLGVGLGASLAGASVPTALVSATAVVFGVISASIAILAFIGKLPMPYLAFRLQLLPTRTCVFTVTTPDGRGLVNFENSRALHSR